LSRPDREDPVQEFPGNRNGSLFPSLAFAFLFLKIHLQVGIVPPGDVSRYK
jgi:hypothetical protein